MKKFNLNHHQNPNWSTYGNKKGSILIWSVMLGFVLTSVFFFFGMRQRANIAIQRDTATILNAKAYLKSFGDYLQEHPSEMPNIDFDGIEGSLTKTVNQIEGIVDTGSEAEYAFGAEVFIEWNKCPNDLKGDILVQDVLYFHDNGSECQSGVTYDDVIGPITVTNSFTIKTLNSPFHYRIIGSNLLDTKWHLDLSTELDYGKKVKISEVYE